MRAGEAPGLARLSLIFKDRPMTLSLIPLNNLLRSKRNTRKTKTRGIDDLAASILTHGLLQNLLVLPIDPPWMDTNGGTAKFEVIAGGRRLAALKKLAREKKIARTHPVPCGVLDGHDPIEISLAENVVREAMHPSDQFQAFKTLADSGHGPEEIAARFGVTATVVRQRLKLAAISPKLMTEYRAGAIDLDQLMALTLSDDHDAQEQAWFEAPTWDRHPARLRAILTKAAVPAGEKRVRFVGLDTYLAAGGGVIRDLFQESHEGYLTDPALLDRLVAEKLEREAEALRGERWKWVEIRADVSDIWQWKKIDPRPVELKADDQAELGRLISQLDELKPDSEELTEAEAAAADEVCERIGRIESKREQWRAEDVAASGAILTLGYDGRLRMERGLIRPGDAMPSNNPAEGNEAENSGSGNSDAEHTGDGRSCGESERLIEDLTAHKTAALRAVAGDNPGAALTLVVHALALHLFGIGSEYETCLTLSVSPEDLAGHAEGIKGTAAMKAVAERHERWSERLPDRPADLWDWLIAQCQDVRLDLLAHCVGLLVHGVRIPHVGEGRRLAGDRLASLVGLDMADWWQATSGSYLCRVPKARILEAVAEGVSPAEAKKLTNLKKDNLVARAEELLRARPWLPPVLRTETAADASQPHREPAEVPSEV